MNNYLKIYGCLLLSLLFLQCKSDDAQYTFALDKTNITLSAVGGIGNVNISVGDSWSAKAEYDEDEESWCTLPVQNGSAGVFSFTFILTENMLASGREMKISISSGGVTKKLTVKQSGRSLLPTVTNSWDIYTGETYRYGPSIIINDDGSVDAWFAASGGTFGNDISLFGNTGKTAISLGSNVAAQKFTSKVPFWKISVCCPNWSGQHCGFTFHLYQWSTDYATTVAASPVATATFFDYEDNSYIGVSNEEKFPAGTYLWELKNGLTTYSGAWTNTGDISGVTSYYNGFKVGYNFQAKYTLDKTTGATFWDQASYQRSYDNGVKWTDEKMVLKPTEYGRDAFSVCDPGVASWGGYYYLGYTTTEDVNMVDNDVYVCRSKYPDGPWEKWNGNGWGGNPEPVIEFTGNHSSFGAGEPSFVVVNDVVYFYYSWNDGSGETATTTRVSTADANNPNWPSALTFRGTAINKSSISVSDHCDVKYREDINKFQAIHTASRMSASSYIVVWQSDDGLKFSKIGEIHSNLEPYLHNCGWSGDGLGHIKSRVQQYISYAYGTDWGRWKTRWCLVRF
ncbi:MAG: BACON domain-containing protein [Paludibacter sp.]